MTNTNFESQRMMNNIQVLQTVSDRPTTANPTLITGSQTNVLDNRQIRILEYLMLFGAFSMGRICWVILNMLLIFLPFILILAGGINLTECPFSIFIPIFVCVTGILSLPTQICRIKFNWRNTKENNNIIKTVQLTFIVITILWFSIGGIYISTLENPSFLSNNKNYCEKNLYETTNKFLHICLQFLIINPIFIFIGFLFNKCIRRLRC